MMPKIFSPDTSGVSSSYQLYFEQAVEFMAKRNYTGTARKYNPTNIIIPDLGEQGSFIIYGLNKVPQNRHPSFFSK
jgi:hypothetical protein